MKSKLPYQLRKAQFYSLLVFGILIIISQTVFYFYKKNQASEIPKIEFLTKPETKIILTEFDPNLLDENQWKKLGFSDKQIKTILKYKQIVGGTFTSKAQFRKCYAVSEEKFDLLKNYILLPENNSATKSANFDYTRSVKKELKISEKFNPDNYSQKDWENLGFSEKQAAAILKYKNYLGGSFVSKEKLKECFIISDEQFSQMKYYLILPEKTPENFKSFSKKSEEKPKIIYKIFDPNLLNIDDWRNLGFSEKQAQTIVNYRDKNLKGSFKSLEDIEKCFVISKEKFEEMKPFIKLNPENISAKTSQNLEVAKKISKPDETEIKTDFSKTDLNQITFRQLREFGFTEKDAAGILAFRKKLGGFINKNQILETYEIDKNIAEKLIYVCQINNSEVKKYHLKDAPEDWLKTHPYFRYSADKIIYYRITNPDDRKIWKLLKLKPEYEERMRLYIITDEKN